MFRQDSGETDFELDEGCFYAGFAQVMDIFENIPLRQYFTSFSPEQRFMARQSMTLLVNWLDAVEAELEAVSFPHWGDGGHGFGTTLHDEPHPPWQPTLGKKQVNALCFALHQNCQDQPGQRVAMHAFRKILQIIYDADTNRVGQLIGAMTAEVTRLKPFIKEYDNPADVWQADGSSWVVDPEDADVGI